MHLTLWKNKTWPVTEHFCTYGNLLHGYYNYIPMKSQEWHYAYLLILSCSQNSEEVSVCSAASEKLRDVFCEIGVLVFLTFSVAPEDCSNDQESYCCGLHSCLCVWSPQDHQTIVNRCDVQVSGAGIYTQKKEKKNLTFTFKPRLTVLAPPLSCKCISFTYDSHILYCFFSPLFP